eukprot:754086-Hanusia_phi.AAC.6
MISFADQRPTMNTSVNSAGRSGVWYESTESMMESRGLNTPHSNLVSSQNRGNFYDGRVLDAEPMNLPDFNMRQVFIPRNMMSKGPTGIGIRFVKEGNEAGPYTVTYVDPQGTAFQSQKVRIGDLIHQVDGILIYDLMPDEVTSRILGPPGSFVSLTISDPPVILPSVSPRDIQTKLIPSEPKSQAPLLDVTASSKSQWEQQIKKREEIQGTVDPNVQCNCTEYQVINFMCKVFCAFVAIAGLVMAAVLPTAQ